MLKSEVVAVAANTTAGSGVSSGDQRHVLRIMRDIREFYNERSEDIHIVAEEEDITTVHALVRGPVKTPYMNGFFYFTVKFSSEYPVKPPKVKLMTTGGHTVRFNPNLYSCGKVCLSILGTWQGPAWTAAQTLFTTLLSVQSLMNEKPYHNEPGFEEYHKGTGFFHHRHGGVEVAKQVENYNQMIEFETIRVAVIGMLDDVGVDSRNMPQVLKNIMISYFKSNYQYYEQFIHSKQCLDGQAISDPFRDPLRPKTFDYKSLLQKLLQLKAKYGITDVPIAGQTPEVTPPSTSPSVSPSASTSSATEARDPLLDSYYEIAAKMIEKTEESKPREKSGDQMDSWDDLIDDMNEELNDENMFEDYSEEESDAEEEEEEDHNQPNP